MYPAVKHLMICDLKWSKDLPPSYIFLKKHQDSRFGFQVVLKVMLFRTPKKELIEDALITRSTKQATILRPQNTWVLRLKESIDLPH